MRTPFAPATKLSVPCSTSAVQVARRAEAVTAGLGGVAAASRATKVARSTIGRGLKDLSAPASLTGRMRRKGAGRPTATAKDPTLLDDLRRLLEPATMGDPNVSRREGNMPPYQLA